MEEGRRDGGREGGREEGRDEGREEGSEEWRVVKVIPSSSTSCMTCLSAILRGFL